MLFLLLTPCPNLPAQTLPFHTAPPRAHPHAWWGSARFLHHLIKPIRSLHRGAGIFLFNSSEVWLWVIHVDIKNKQKLGGRDYSLYLIFLKDLFINWRETESTSWGRGRGRGGITSRRPTELGVWHGSWSQSPRSWPGPKAGVGCLIDGATQTPLFIPETSGQSCFSYMVELLSENMFTTQIGKAEWVMNEWTDALGLEKTHENFLHVDYLTARPWHVPVYYKLQLVPSSLGKP